MFYKVTITYADYLASHDRNDFPTEPLSEKEWVTEQGDDEVLFKVGRAESTPNAHGLTLVEITQEEYLQLLTAMGAETLASETSLLVGGAT